MGWGPGRRQAKANLASITDERCALDFLSCVRTSREPSHSGHVPLPAWPPRHCPGCSLIAGVLPRWVRCLPEAACPSGPVGRWRKCVGKVILEDLSLHHARLDEGDDETNAAIKTAARCRPQGGGGGGPGHASSRTIKRTRGRQGAGAEDDKGPISKTSEGRKRRQEVVKPATFVWVGCWPVIRVTGEGRRIGGDGWKG